jgi:hypothetical protein
MDTRPTTPTPDIVTYANVMKELKLRMEVLRFFLTGKGHALYQPPTVESCCLQVRKMLELIAFASLAANKDLYSAAFAKFATHWHAGRLLRDLQTVNADFYPKPIIEMPSTKPGVTSEWKDRDPTECLTKADFVAAYDACGAIMHARNPYAQPIDYPWYQQQLTSWQTKILNLLNSHTVHLANYPGFYLIHMEETGDKEVHWYEFTPGPAPGTVVLAP